ncbi:MAG: hypothetical protein LM550_01905 [Candidatus Contendobacter sp.]|jgi:hypothetical protein|nr:hypothetical protein [Gammaproteobacteria bacterium]MCC8992459.1 hypothetical protein [Candidatus Contendobacter sp.]
MRIRFHFRWFCVAPVLFLSVVANAQSGQEIPKDGVCPTGYHTEGHYCVGNRR